MNNGLLCARAAPHARVKIAATSARTRAACTIFASPHALVAGRVAPTVARRKAVGRGTGRLRGRRLFGPPLRDRPGILPTRIDIAVDQLDHADRGGIPIAETGLEHAGIAALAVLVAR